MNKKTFFIIIALLLFSGRILAARAAEFSVSPVMGEYKIGNIFKTNIILDTKEVPVDGVDISLLYNPNLLQAQDSYNTIEGLQILAGILFPNTNLNLADNTAGKINFSQTSNGGFGFNGLGTVAEISFKVLAEGNGLVNFDFVLGATNDSNVASLGEDVLNKVINGEYNLKKDGDNNNNNNNNNNNQTPSQNTPPTAPGGNGGGGGGGGGGNYSPQTPPIIPVVPAHPSVVTNFNTETLNKRVAKLKWDNPSGSDFKKIIILKKEKSFSKSINDGKVVYEGIGEEFLDKNYGLSKAKKYYYTVYAVDNSLNEVSLSKATIIFQPTIFKRTLYLGRKGKDVLKLQEILFADKNQFYPECKKKKCGKRNYVTGYYGNGTRKAVIRFQEKYKNEILTPNGLKKGTGVFSKSTIKKFDEFFGY